MCRLHRVLVAPLFSRADVTLPGAFDSRSSGYNAHVSAPASPPKDFTVQSPIISPPVSRLRVLQFLRRVESRQDVGVFDAEPSSLSLQRARSIGVGILSQGPGCLPGRGCTTSPSLSRLLDGVAQSLSVSPAIPCGASHTYKSRRWIRRAGNTRPCPDLSTSATMRSALSECFPSITCARCGARPSLVSGRARVRAARCSTPLSHSRRR